MQGDRGKGRNVIDRERKEETNREESLGFIDKKSRKRSEMSERMSFREINKYCKNIKVKGK